VVAVSCHRDPGLDEGACAGATETDGDRWEDDDGEHTRADECGGILGQHRPRVQTDLRQRDQQRQGGRCQQVVDPAAAVDGILAQR
jgi:hypothetical protein